MNEPMPVRLRWNSVMRSALFLVAILSTALRPATGETAFSVEQIDRHLQEVAAQIQANALEILAPLTDAARRHELLRENEVLKRYAAGLRARREQVMEAQGRGQPLGTPVAPLPELGAAEMGTALVELMLERYPHFARLEEQERKGAAGPPGEDWDALARDLAVFEPAILKAAQEGRLTEKHFGQYGLRTLLLLGQARLYASVAWFKQPPPGRLEAYREPYRLGVETLERVISLATEEIELVPMFNRSGPRAFFEVIGARTPTAAGVGQVKTSLQARKMLQDFCPWGWQTLWTLEESGLLGPGTGTAPAQAWHGLDMAILRPYGGDGLFRTVSPALSRLAASFQAPKTWERTLLRDVPEALRREVEAIVGDDQTFTGQIWRAGRVEPVEWAVGVKRRTHFMLMVVSPAVFDLSAAQFASGMFGALEIPFKKTKEILLDGGFDIAGMVIKELCGENSTAHVMTEVIVVGRGVTKDVMEALLESNPTGVVRKTADAGFTILEKSEMNLLLDGIEPQQVAVGRSYHGMAIPPVFVIADVFGFDRVKPYEHVRQRHIRLVWRLKPEALTGQAKYDLTGALPSVPGKQAYLSPDAETRANKTREVWPRAEGPLGLREQVITVMPKSQLLRISLPDEQFRDWVNPRAGERGPAELKALLHSPMDVAPGYTETPLVELPLTQRLFAIQLFPRGILDNCPDGVDPLDVFSRLPRHEVQALAARGFRLGAEISADRRLVAPLATEYYVRILRNGVEVEKLFLNFGPRHKKRPMLGKITHRPNGMAVLDYPGQDDLTVTLHPIDVQPNMDNLYPVTLKATARSTWAQKVGSMDLSDPTPLLRMPFGDREAQISAELTGFDLEVGTYSARLVVGGRAYTMWGVVRRPGRGAAMACEVYVPVGRHEVSVTVPGAPPFWFVIERAPPGQRSTTELERLRQRFAGSRAIYQQNPSRENAYSLSRSARDLAEHLALFDRHDEALQLFKMAFELDPNIDNPFFYRHFRLAAFRAGDKDALSLAGLREANCHMQEARRIVQEKGPHDPVVVQKARDGLGACRQTLRHYVSLGGEGAVADLIYTAMIGFWPWSNYDSSLWRDGLAELPPWETQ